MPEYLAPGVYVEEVSYRAKSIEGVSTTTTGFIGPTKFGPLDLEPDIVTSLGEYEQVYGDRSQFVYEDTAPMHNYMWHAARAFFEEGGKRLYVVRTFMPGADDGFAEYLLPPLTGSTAEDGGADTATAAELADSLLIQSRFPGAAGNVKVSLTLRRGQNVHVVEAGSGEHQVKGLQHLDVVHVENPLASPPGGGGFQVAHRLQDSDGTIRWELRGGGNTRLETLGEQVMVRRVTLSVTVTPPPGSFALPRTWEDMPLDPGHERGGSPDSVFAYFAADPPNRSLARSLPVVIVRGDDLDTGVQVLDVLLGMEPDLGASLLDATSTDEDRSVEVVLGGGNDGVRPDAGTYAGEDRDGRKSGLVAFEDIEDISIVAAPGSTFGYEGDYQTDAQTIVNALISHAQRMRYRIAVLDSGDGQTVQQVRAMRGRVDSTYAALYYPWVRVLDPVTRREIHLPPSGFISGIYARNDIQRAVYKAPANEVVTMALGFERMINKGQQEVLNPEGINCLRFFEGRGFRVWGARTISSDPEWKYVNLRRYFAYLERSIDKGTQWAVFEPNGDALWANVRRTVEDFLLNEWQMGALLGDKPEKAFFVKCDRTTMTQNDLDNGRLVCLVGVAPLRPAEFVIFRIGQWTADKR